MARQMHSPSRVQGLQRSAHGSTVPTEARLSMKFLNRGGLRSCITRGMLARSEEGILQETGNMSSLKNGFDYTRSGLVKQVHI